jgi:alanine-alpha-ketoisovalerate/valine-pyruvate aminotransferase
MSWNYIPSDRYDLDQLHSFRDFFEEDLAYAQNQMRHTMSLQKYGLPGWRQMFIAAKMAVEESQYNLDQVNQAIESF